MKFIKLIISILFIFLFHCLSAQCSKIDAVVKYIYKNNSTFVHILKEDSKYMKRFNKKQIQYDILSKTCRIDSKVIIEHLDDKDTFERVMKLNLKNLIEIDTGKFIATNFVNNTIIENSDSNSLYVLRFSSPYKNLVYAELHRFFNKEEKYAFGSLLSRGYFFLFYVSDDCIVKRMVYTSKIK